MKTQLFKIARYSRSVFKHAVRAVYLRLPNKRGQMLIPDHPSTYPEWSNYVSIQFPQPFKYPWNPGRNA